MVIRKAEIDDLYTVFQWINDPLVRANSFSTEEISLEQHTNWFKNKIKDKNTLYLISEFNNVRVGQVRFEIKNGEYIIGVLLDEKFRGKGFSSKIIQLSIEEFFKTDNSTIFAYIKNSNFASLSTFHKCGFKEVNSNLELESKKLALTYEDWKSFNR